MQAAKHAVAASVKTQVYFFSRKLINTVHACVENRGEKAPIHSGLWFSPSSFSRIHSLPCFHLSVPPFSQLRFLDRAAGLRPGRRREERTAVCEENSPGKANYTQTKHFACYCVRDSCLIDWMASNEAGEARAGKGIDLPVRSRRQTTSQVQTCMPKKKKRERNRHSHDSLSLWGYKLVLLLLLREAVSVCSGRQMKGSRWRGNFAVLPL